MSVTQDTTGAPKGQDSLAGSHKVGTLAEVIGEALTLLRGLNVLIGVALTLSRDPQAAKLLLRFLSLSDAILIPGGDFSGNTALAATLLDREQTNIDRLINRHKIPTTRPISDRILRFADIAQAGKEEPAGGKKTA